jgi:hypothetical protein
MIDGTISITQETRLGSIFSVSKEMKRAVTIHFLHYKISLKIREISELVIVLYILKNEIYTRTVKIMIMTNVEFKKIKRA